MRNEQRRSWGRRRRLRLLNGRCAVGRSVRLWVHFGGLFLSCLSACELFSFDTSYAHLLFTPWCTPATCESRALSTGGHSAFWSSLARSSLPSDQFLLRVCSCALCISTVCKKRNRSHTQTHNKNNPTHNTTRTTQEQHNTRHDKNNTTHDHTKNHLPPRTY